MRLRIPGEKPQASVLCHPMTSKRLFSGTFSPKWVTGYFCSWEWHSVLCGYFSLPDRTSATGLACERPDPILTGTVPTLESSSVQGHG